MSDTCQTIISISASEPTFVDEIQHYYSNIWASCQLSEAGDYRECLLIVFRLKIRAKSCMIGT